MKNWMEKNLGRRLLAMVLCLSMVLSMAPVPSFAEGCTHHPEHTAECGYVAAVQGQPCGHTHTDACYTFQTVCLHSDHGDCGYVAPVEEVSCACQPNENGEMVHTEGCGYVPAVAGVPCGHVCSVESGCVTKTLNCTHQHDETCGYVQGVEGSSCTFVCQECSQLQETEPPATPVCSCETKCAEGNATESCQVCAVNIEGCTGEEPEAPVPETCAHGNALGSCETCTSEARVAAVQAQIDALPEEVTAETKEAAQTDLNEVDTAKAALTETEQAQLDMTRYTALAEKLAALEAELNKCAHGNDPAACEACASEARVAEVQAQIDALPKVEELTAETEAQVREQLATVKAAVEALTAEEQALLTLDKYTALTDYFTALDKAATEPTEPEPIVVTDWLWDYDEYIDEASGCMVLPITPEEFAAYLSDEETFEVIQVMLPGAVLFGEEELALGEWTYEPAPEGTPAVEIEGVTYQPEGFFKTTLPEGYVLEDGTNELSLTLVLIPTVDEENTPVTYDTVSDISYRTCDSSGQNWWNETCTSATVVTGSDTGWGTAGATTWYVVQASDSPLTISSRVTVNGNVHLILADGCDFTVNGGICVNSGNSLTIYGQKGGTGVLTADAGSSNNNAGIGGSSSAGGSITINGGIVTAFGGGTVTANGDLNGGAGIGGGNNGSGGNITINGGTVNATGSSGGAGIGGGNNGSGGNITINGGNKITAKGDFRGAGIGGGSNCSGDIITINGGTVFATGSSGGAGIGGGSDGSGGTIKITDGTVTAKGGVDGAGIGGGFYGASGKITIEGGTVTATSNSSGNGGAGIGGGNMGKGDDITISGGNVTATGGFGGAGIGGGYKGTGGKITISGGNVTANGGNQGAGIGGGYYGSGGTFSTNGGNPVIFASSISDQSGKQAGAENPWSGVIFEGNDGQVYGSVTPTRSFEVPANKNLLIPEGATLNIPDTITVTNSGKVYMNGGTVSGEFSNTGTGGVYYPLTVTGGIATGANTDDVVTHQEKTYARMGSTITLKAGDGLTTVAWKTSDENVMVLNNTFTMPAGALTVTAEKCVAIVKHMNGQTYCYYSNFIDAFKSGFLRGGTLTLVENVTCTENLTTDGNFTLNLNGHTLDMSDYSITIAGSVDTSLTIQGSAEGSVLKAGSLSVGSQVYDEQLGGYPSGTLNIMGGQINAHINVVDGSNAYISGGEFVKPRSNKSLISLLQKTDEMYSCWYYEKQTGTEGGEDTFAPVSKDTLGKPYTGTLYVRAHTHDEYWKLTNVTEALHTHTCSVCGGAKTENHSNDAAGVCTECGAGMVSYVNAKGVPQAEQFCYRITAEYLEGTNYTLSAGWYVVKDTVIIGTAEVPQRVTVSGNVNLILADNCNLTVNGGIQVQDDDNNNNTVSANSLTIYAQSTGGKMGKLTAQNVSKYNAGIGGNEESNAGTITINGGNVNATGKNGGAGIGGGDHGSGGTITINGGTVIATGGNGAGIGGGYNGTGGTITINGGNVTANGGDSGAGIGGGWEGSGGEITITDGNVTAKGGENGAGIGGGYKGIGGEITITGGTVNATGGENGAGIGGKITISGTAIVGATGGKYGAGIGGGLNGSGGTIKINGGEITATGGDLGAGIGGGYKGTGGDITISGGTVTASSGSGSGAGIGGGTNGSGGNITITGGEITATGNGGGAGIGGGTINITGGTVNAIGGELAAGIGPGRDNSDGTVKIDGGTVLSVGGYDAYAYIAKPTLKEGLKVSAGESKDGLKGVECANLTNPTTFTKNKAVKTEACSVHETGTAVYKDAEHHVSNCKWCGAESEEAHSFGENGNCVCGAVRVNYLDEKGIEQTANCNAEITAEYLTQNSNTLSSGWYVVKGTFTHGSRITVNGDVKLILADNCNLTVNGGIGVNEGNSLTIYAQSKGSTMGKLTAQNVSESNAGIGGNEESNAGSITINGGNITAKGHNYGAGIGGGYYGSGGSITITGGKVLAQGVYAAGIGYGYNGSGGNVVISGGNVTTGLCHGPGIGGSSFSTGTNGSAVINTHSISDKSNEKQWSAIVFINGNGTVYGTQTLTEDMTIEWWQTLTVPEGASLTIPESVTLTNEGTLIKEGTINGTVTGNQPKVTVTYKDPTKTTDDDPSAICTIITADYLTEKKNTLSAGWYVVQGELTIGDASNVQRITVDGNVNLILADKCEFTVNGGIQVKDNDYNINNGSPNSLTIYAQSKGDNMGKLTAQKVSDNNAGIGGNTWSSGSITINGGEITANGGYMAAGIGGGDSGSGGNITINGGTVTANGGEYAAGIGGGDSGSGGSITINGGNVTATGGDYGAGIGGGNRGSGGSITISGGIVTARGNYGAGIGGGDQGTGGSITISGGNVTANGTNGGAGIGNGSSAGGGTNTFSTTASGNPVIFASSISDQSGKQTGAANPWSGVIFEDNDGQVYGTNVTPAQSFEVPANKNLLIPAGASLDISGITVTNKGKVYMNGGTVSGAFTNTENGGVYYPLTLTGCTANGVTYQEKTYAKAGETVTLTATPDEGKMFTGWQSDDVDIQDSSFKMPSKAVTITAEFADIVATVTVGETVTNHLDFMDAFNKANTETGSTLTLMKDVTTTETLTVTGSFTLDLNGFTLTSAAADQAITVNKNGSLTITDGTVAKTGAIAGGGTNSVLIKSRGTLNLNAGSLKNTVSNEWSGTLNISGTGCVDVSNQKSAVKNEGILTISGGTLTGRFCVLHANGTTNITGGTFTPKYYNTINPSYCIYFGVADNTGSSLTIEGGTFNRGSGDQKTDTFYIGNEAYRSGLKVSGGTFNGGVSVKNDSNFTKNVTPVDLLVDGKAYFTVGEARQLLDGSQEITVTAKVEAHDQHTFSYAAKDDNTHTATCSCGYSVTKVHSLDETNTVCICGRAAYWDVTANQTKYENCRIITEDYLNSKGFQLTSGWYVVQGELTIGDASNVQRITVNDEVHLILADGCNFTVNGGIQVQDNDRNINTVSTNSLTIYAQSTGKNMGKLTAQNAGYHNAGIGGGGEDPGGNITIRGGNVTAKGGEKAAGIGGGWYSNGGTITINGGTVTANGGKDGAGIGGGWYSNGGNITISGGTVTATGGSGGAGIGSGVNGSGGIITINGGTVNATGNGGGAGIGGGPHTNASVDVDGGNITIRGGNVTAKGGEDAAGIGGGYYGSGGTITINGGTVNATGGENGAGIGGGRHIDSDQIGSGGNITISGGTVTAAGGKDGAGIGGGGNGSGGNITINGGTVNATGNGGGAGIGGGPHTISNVEVNGGNITISGGNVTATGKYGGAGIGAGDRGTPGTFQTQKKGEADGTAVIYASYISDQSGKYYNSWRGIIFEGNDGQVYGTNVTPAQSFEVPANKNLLIPANTRLTISDGITAANSGKVYMNGGTVSGAFTNTENGGVYYPLTLTNCTANGVTSTYQNKTYAKAGETVTLTPNNADAGKMFTGWQPVGVINEDRSFTMPEKPVSVTAEFADIVASVTDGENTFNFASLQEAFNAANGNTATITLLKDVEISETLEITGGNVTFQSAVKPDSAVTKEYTITAEGQTDAITVNGGTLNFQSGNIAVNNFAWSIRVNGGTVNITGGTIHTVAAGKGSSLNISGGTIDGLSVDGAETALSGGSFDSVNTSTGTVSDLLANGHAYKLLPQSTWVDQTHGNIGQALTGDIQVLSIPVSIKTQPENVSFTYGETNKTLSVGANGESISYQWYEVKDGNTSEVTGKTGATYDVSNLNAGSYKYFCRLTCEGYVLDSNTVNVTVNKANNNWTTEPVIEGWTYGENAKAPTYAAKFGTVTVEYSADGSAYSETVPTTAGSYKAHFTVAGTDNYGSLSEVKDFTISPREITVTITPGGGTYGGTITGATAEINEELVGNDQVPVTLTYTGTDYNSTTAPTQAGTYTVTATIDNPNYSLAETTATFEIGKATVTTPTVESKAYTGKPQTAVVPKSDRYTVTSNLGGTDAGNYDVVLTLTDSDNYQWDSAGGKTTFRITQAENSWTEKPAIEGWTYGDNPSTPVGEAQFGTVKVEYSASADNYNEAVPTDAGSYNARFTVEETKNYKGLSEVRSFSIAKRQLTIIWSEETTFTYNGEEQYPNASAGNVAKGDNVTLNISGGTDVGSYTAICKSFTQTGEESTRGNYMGPTEDLEKSFSITAKPLTVKVQVADKQYDGKNTAAFDGTPTLEGVVGKDDVKLVNGTPTFTSVAVATGISIEFTDFSITGTASPNYTLTQPTGIKANITSRPISDADITVKLDTSSFVYDGMEKSPNVTVEYGTTTLVENTDYTLSGNTATNAGSYTLTITGMGNYSSTNVVGWKITKAPITPVVNIANAVYGEDLNPSVSGNTENGEVTYTYYSDAACETKVTPKNVGTYYVKAAVAETVNYQSGTSEAVSFQITKKALTVTAKDKTITYGDAPANDGVAYDGFVSGETEAVLVGTLAYDYSYSQYGDVGNSYTITPKGLTSGNYNITFADGTLTVEQKEIGITWGDTQFTYNGSTQMPTATPTGMVNSDAITLTVSGEQTNVGDNYTATVDAIEGDKASNYKLPENRTQTFSIAKVAPAFTAPTAKELTYSGQAQALVNAGSTGHGTMLYSLAEDGTYTGNLPTGTNAGSYTVWYKVQGDANHLDSEPVSVSCSIAKASLTITAKDKTITYGEAPANDGVAYDGFVNGETETVLGGTLAYDYSYSQYGDVGNSYTITPKGQTSGNYDITFADGKLTVEQKEIGISWGNTAFTYNGSAQKPDATPTGMVNSDAITLTVSGQQTNVGTAYTATVTDITGEKADNYKLPTSGLSTQFSITAKPLTVNVRVADKQYDGKNTAAFDGTPTLEGVVGNDDVTLVNGTPTFKTVGVGKGIEIVFTNGFSLTGKASGNYTLTQPTDVTASIYNRYTALEGTDFTSNTGSANANGWLNQALVIRAGEGFQISATNTAEGEWTDKLTVDKDGEGTLTFYVRNTQTGAISQAVNVPYKLDTKKPSAEIKFGTDAVTEKGDPKTLYLSSTIQVTITGTDGTSDIGSVSHCLSAEELNDSQLESAAWVSSSSFQVEAVDTASYRVYTKVVDNAGNVAYFRSNRFIFDTTAPSITGVEDGKTYYTTQTITITDTNLKSLTLNGAAATSPITLEGNMDATHIIEATDKAGTTTTYTVYMKTLDSLVAEDVEDVDASNVSKDNKENLEKAKEDLENQLASATEAEQGTINELLEPINEALAALKNVEAVEAVIKNLPDSIQIDDEDPADENAIKAARAAYEALSGHEQTLADISKLTKLESDLVAYGIISGDGSVWNMGSGEDQVFTANGPVRKFQKVELDNEKLDEANYQVTMGSTIVTLNAAFMQTLEESSHTLAVFYTDGQTKEAKFEVKRSQNYLDLTEEPAFQGRTEVFVDGVSYPIEKNGDSYVNLPETGDLLTLYTYRTGAGDYGDYPTGMEVYRINRSAGGTTVTHIPELSNLLQYSGCSIRVTGNRGIRMITSLDQGKKAALTGAGLAGFTLEEYGTVVTWASDLGEGDLNLNSGKHNFAYKRGVADPVFGTSGSLTQYTNVLVDFSLEECSKDIVMRPYIILKDAAGNQHTLYGGHVTRSISYIAWQNRDTYQPGTAAYDYVHELMGNTAAG